MNKYLIVIILLAIVIAIALTVFRSASDNVSEQDPQGRNESILDQSATILEDWYEATGNEGIPPPDMDPDRIHELWPDVFEPAPDKERIRRQWRDFSQLYPDNLYIPVRYLPEPTREESKRRVEILGTVAKVQSQIAALQAKGRGSRPGQDGPPAPSEPTVTPEEQRTYFNYRIRQLRSKIQLLEYYLAKNDVDATRRSEINSELAGWNSQLETYETLLATLPKE